MKPITKTLLSWTGRVLGAVVVLAAGLVAYAYAVMPRPIGDKPQLQEALFMAPQQQLDVDERLVNQSAVALAAMIREGRTTSTAVVRAHLNRIKNENHRTNAFVWLFEEEALESARRADEKVARGEPLGRLHGVPVSVKEEFPLQGKPQTVNSDLYRGFIAPRTAAVVEAWMAEGAIVLGTTNVPSLLIDVQTFGDLYPPASNPYDSTRTPGGSTGGGAASVADGLVPLALGADMGGSIRVPAAFCGLYGLKTTEGATGSDFSTFPGEPGTPKYKRMAVAGPLARTVDDLNLGWSAMMSGWPEQQARMLPPKASLEDYHLAYLDDWTFGDDRMYVGRAVKERLESLVQTLRGHGVTVTRDEPAGFGELLPMHRVLSVYMAFEHVPWIFRQLMVRDYRAADSRRFNYDEAFARLSDVDADKYDEILTRRDALSRGVDTFLGKYDFLLLPVTAGPAIAHNQDHQPIPLDGQAITYWDYFAYPMVFNVTGHPALTIPLGLDDAGLPLAVQVVGPKYSEPQLIGFAKLIEPLHAGYVPPAPQAHAR